MAHSTAPSRPKPAAIAAAVAPPGPIAARSAFFAYNATVFVSSGAIMMLEVVAGRFISKHLGSSVYTWTSVIGIVLAGIALGNYLGGLIADRHSSRRTLSRLFILGSAMAGLVTILDQVAANWPLLWGLSWPMRVASHVAVVFFVPTLFLGMISPCVAKLALDLGRQKGRTIGDIYAWGTVGSIIGTFAAGFFLIAALGTNGVVWAVAGILALMGILYNRPSPLPYLWAVAAIGLTWLAVGDAAAARRWGERLMLRPEHSARVIYRDESKYSYIEVVQFSEVPDFRGMNLDTLLHSQVNISNPADFHYEYERVYAAVTEYLRPTTDSVDSLTIGGGGYVYPRYMHNRYPRGRTEVVEIDPAVTKAAATAFGLPPYTEIICHHSDGRVYVDNMRRANKSAQQSKAYDFIYCDAVNDYSVPHQLTTLEFMTSVRSVLKADGAFLMNMIDVYDSGLLLGSLIRTMQAVFPNVCVMIEGTRLSDSDGKPLTAYRASRSTFVIVGTNVAIPNDDLGRYYSPDSSIYRLTSAEIADLVSRPNTNVLTDEFAPVENLLAPVVRDSAKLKLRDMWLDYARRKLTNDQPDDAIEAANTALSLLASDEHKIPLLEVLAGALERKQHWFDAKAKYEQILSITPNLDRALVGVIRCLEALNRNQETLPYYRVLVKVRPNDALARFNEGMGYLDAKQYASAANSFRTALELEPSMCSAWNNLGASLLAQGRQKQAVEALRRALKCDPAHLEARRNLNNILGVDSEKLETEASTSLARLRDRPNDSKLLSHLANTYFQLRMAEEALLAYERLLITNPDDVQCNFRRASLLVELNRLPEAASAFERVLTLDSKHPEAQAALRSVRDHLQSNLKRDNEAGFSSTQEGPEFDKK